MGRCVIASVFFGCSLDSETIAISIGIRDIVGDRIGKACKGALHGVENLSEQRRGEEIRPAAIGQIIEETIHRGRCATIQTADTY